MDEYIGKRIGNRYDIISLTGSGGMSYVYKALDTASGKNVAVKFLKHELFENDEIVRRFKNESKAISLLNHPNIIRVIDMEMDEKEKYIVMEYIDGITLKEYMDNNSLSVKDILNIMQILLPAIEHAHANGIIHRDLKPHNVMLNREGKLKIMDFGIARLATSNQRTMTDKAIGSVHYISPEQVRGQNTDARADVYSLGVMLYEMATKQLPFTGDSNVSVAMKQLNEEAVKPREINKDIPEGLEQIILKAMNKNLEERYQSVSELLADIKKLKAEPGHIFPYGRKPEPPKEKPVQLKPPFKFGLKHMFMLTAFVFLSSMLTIYFILKTSGSPIFNNYKAIELPNFVGYSMEEIENSGYKFKYELDYVYSSEYPEDVVIYQAPKPPKTVRENTTIKLRVSKGLLSEWMPNLTNFTTADAQKAMAEYDVNFMIVIEEHPKIRAGRVIRTEPALGERITSGDTLKLVISRGDGSHINMVFVPGVTGLTSISDAQKVLGKNNLHLGTYARQYNDDFPKDVIIEQAPVAGSEVRAGSAVNIIISDGPEPCAECQSTEHKTDAHPICELCESKEHITEEHECENCKAKGEHITEDCPMCTEHEGAHELGKCPWCEEHNKEHLIGECPEPTPTPVPTPTPTPEATPTPTIKPEPTPTPTPEISAPPDPTPPSTTPEPTPAPPVVTPGISGPGIGESLFNS